MDSLALIRTLQLTDSFFPVGAFAYSDGLETAASSGRIHDGAGLGEWMEHFLQAVFIPCEGLAVAKCMQALERRDAETLTLVDQELTALRPSRSVRAASTGAGQRLLSMYSTLRGGEGSTAFTQATQALPHRNAAAAYALVYFDCGIGERDAVLAYGYNKLAGIVSAGLRLISIGQQQGQLLLTRVVERLPDAVSQILEMRGEPLRAFSPMLDIHQMNHQYVYSRLFRS